MDLSKHCRNSLQTLASFFFCILVPVLHKVQSYERERLLCCCLPAGRKGHHAGTRTANTGRQLSSDCPRPGVNELSCQSHLFRSSHFMHSAGPPNKRTCMRTCISSSRRRRASHRVLLVTILGWTPIRCHASSAPSLVPLQSFVLLRIHLLLPNHWAINLFLDFTALAPVSCPLLLDRPSMGIDAKAPGNQ